MTISAIIRLLLVIILLYQKVTSVDHNDKVEQKFHQVHQLIFN